ncbi:MAG TPA: hypothetical protein PKO33_09010 [Pyrinomonadaceae bacterium]|nr:hypothetical protein [Pyrinomonadaceae bacterium]
MLLAILAAYFGYKKAKATGRNGFLWAAISVGAFIGMQFLFGIAVGFAVMASSGFQDLDNDPLQGHEAAVGFAAIVPAAVVVWLIFRYLDRMPPDEEVNGPPEPPTFGEDT